MFSLVPALLATSPAHAQTAPAPDAQQASAAQSAPAAAQAAGSGLEEIVVTAQKREQNLQQTPIAITAVSAATISARGYVNVSQIAQTVPNLSFDTGSAAGGSSSAAVIFLRGVGQTDFLLTTDPGVGTYVNDVYLSRSIGGVLNLLDIERIEVLRGPQGTLFGRNTIGGAIAVTTGKPQNETQARLEATTGSYNRADIRGLLNIPIVGDKLAFRASFSSRNRDGYVQRVLAGDRANEDNQQSARVALRWWATDDLTIDLEGDATRAREKGMGSTMVATEADIQSNQFSTLLNQCVTDVIPGCSARIPASQRMVYDTRYLTHDPYKTNSTAGNISDLDVYGTDLTAKWRVGGVTLKSITAYRHMKSRFAFDADGTPLDLLSSDDRWKHNQFSQEVQLTGKALNNRLDYAVGVYYFKESGLNTADVPIYPSLFPALGIPLGVTGYMRVRNTNYGAFSQLTYALTDTLHLTAGGRYSHERKFLDVSRFTVTDLGIPLVAAPIGSRSFGKFTPKVSLDWQATPHSLFYASYSQGFKSGGFTGRYTVPRPALEAFSPETVTSYEVGSKNELFDRHLRLNVAAFRADYNNIQIVVQEGATPITRNAAKGRIQGFELEATAIPVEGLEINYALGYTDAKYLSITDPRAQVTPSDLFVDTPRWNMSGSIQYIIGLQGHGSLVPRVDATYRTRQAKDAANTPEIMQPRFGTIDARLTYRSPNEDFQIAVFGTNLTNKAYIVTGSQNLAAIATGVANYGRPREWGLTVSKRF